MTDISKPPVPHRGPLDSGPGRRQWSHAKAADILASASRIKHIVRGPGEFPAPPPDSDLAQVHGHGGLPIVGNVPLFFRDQAAWARNRYDRYGAVSWMNMLGRRGVVALGPDAAETVFMNRDKAFGNTDAWQLATGPFVRRGLLLLEFEEHMQHRRIMQQAFTRPRLEGYQQIMNPVIQQRISEWSSGERRMLPTIKNLSLELAGRIFFGDDLTAAELEVITHAFHDMLGGAAALVRYPVPGLNWAKGVAGRRTLEEFVRSRLPAKRAGDGNDLFSALCRAVSAEGESFTDEDIVNHMIFVLFAAHDTSTSTMNTMIANLAQHPEWQERARAESMALGKTELDFADLDRLATLDLVMKESIRMVVPISVTFRQTVADTQILGHFVPKDTIVFLIPQFNHNMAEYWPDPSRFDPDRFSEERREDRVHKFAWAPFGGGAHKCIGLYFAGMEIKSILHAMLINYEWSVRPGYRAKYDFSRLPTPADGLPVRLTSLDRPVFQATA
ncbi:cytochrome P450 [Nocardia inohanensis]|uniref:cytochrome P450 n=1 Tax=Nocardia inohanensis TaxID=209246 RepID=UPI0009FE3CF5|nr:cytochrome P450 [Nocardia inohanensis]